MISTNNIIIAKDNYEYKNKNLVSISSKKRKHGSSRKKERSSKKEKKEVSTTLYLATVGYSSIRVGGACTSPLIIRVMYRAEPHDT